MPFFGITNEKQMWFAGQPKTGGMYVYNHLHKKITFTALPQLICVLPWIICALPWLISALTRLMQVRMVELTIFARANPSHHGSNVDFLEPSWAKKLESEIVRAELSHQLEYDIAPSLPRGRCQHIAIFLHVHLHHLQTSNGPIRAK